MTTTTRAWLAAMTAAGAVSAMSSVASGQVLFSQPNDRPTQQSFISGVSGQFIDDTFADDFSLAGSGPLTITGVRFWGGSQNFSSVEIGNVAAFRIAIFSGTTAAVGSQLLSVDIPRGATNQVATGQTIFGGGIQYEHTLALPTALTGLSSGTYWVSIAAVLTAPFSDQWVWSGSNAGNLINATNFNDGFGFTVFNPTFNDLAFEIIGIPSPGSVAVLALSGVLGFRRRR